ncbi:MAG: D-alanine--D-alanine ligase [Lentimicrobiaceae bacterium]|nr:D-alanine--D-alanine ligase [Lentimicrobiaceae bacterium]
MKKHNVALFFGGNSGERSVSIESAKMVNKCLDKNLFNVYPIDIYNNEWIYKDSEASEYYFDRNLNCLNVKGNNIKFDVAFIAIHGTPGEDGKLQGYLDMANIPYTSCNVTTAALTFNKYLCNQIAAFHGINVPKTFYYTKRDAIDIDFLVRELSLPFFVKPNKSGSSCGISKVYKAEEVPAAFDKAFAEDDEVLAQKMIKGRELACGVYFDGEKIVALPITEIISHNDFFDYEAKYTKGKADEITPANISAELAKQCQKLSVDIYRHYACKGVVRADFFLTEDEQWWFIEINTVPGFSEASIIPQQVRAAGIDLQDFFKTIVLNAINNSF